MHTQFGKRRHEREADTFSNEFRHAGTHAAGGTGRSRYGDHSFRIDIVVADQPSDFLGKEGGFASARPREKQEWTFNVL
jgi:hypothetical protein